MHQVAELKKLSVNYSYELMRFVYGMPLSVKSCYRLVSVKNILKSVKRLALRALSGVWWLGRGAFVGNSCISCIHEQVKRGLIGLCLGVGVVVLCQYRVTPAVLPLCWACTSNTLHGGRLTVGLYATHPHLLTDPHPLNFGARCYIHPTLTQTTFSSSIRLCTDEQYINKEYA